MKVNLGQSYNKNKEDDANKLVKAIRITSCQLLQIGKRFQPLRTFREGSNCLLLFFYMLELTLTIVQWYSYFTLKFRKPLTQSVYHYFLEIKQRTSPGTLACSHCYFVS